MNWKRLLICPSRIHNLKFRFRVVTAFPVEGPMASSYCNIIVSPLLHFSKVLSNQFPQYVIWPFYLVPMISLYAENSLRKYTGFAFGLKEKDMVKRGKIKSSRSCDTMRQLTVTSKGRLPRECTCFILSQVALFLWRQHNPNAHNTHTCLPQRASDPRSKKAELPLETSTNSYSPSQS